MATGTTTIKKVGVAMMIAMSVIMMPKKQLRRAENEGGRVASTMLMSLENLLRMRPRGVVSKKDMGERRMLERIRLCRPLEAK